MEKEFRPKKIFLNAPCLIFFQKYEKLMEYGYGHDANETLIVSNHQLRQWLDSKCIKNLNYNPKYDKKQNEQIKKELLD